MEDSKTLVITAFIALSATLATGALSFFGARLGSKETIYSAKRKNRFDGDMKIAEYRLQWIENLRSEIIDLDKIVMSCLINRNMNKTTEIAERISAITFRMNPADPRYDQLISAIYMMGATSDTDLVRENRTTFVRLAQEIMKAERDRLRLEINRAGDHDVPQRMLPASYGKTNATTPAEPQVTSA